MTVRFKCQTEYQKSYRASQSRSASPPRCAPFAGLRSDQMGISREPGVQRRKRPGSLGAARSFSSLLCPDYPDVGTHGREKTAGFRSRSVHRKEPSIDPKPPRPPGSELETPAGPRPAADPGPQERPDPESSVRPGSNGKSVKPHPLEPDSQSQPSRPVTGDVHSKQQPSDNKVDRSLWWKAGLRTEGQRSGVHGSEYHRKFSWKKPVSTASPLQAAEQALYSSSKSAQPFKKLPVSMETEYRRSFRGLVPATGPRLRSHLEHQRVPLKVTNPPQAQKRHRMLTEYQSSFRSFYRNPEGGGEADGVIQQVKDLRQQARFYRHRAWGTNFCRDHLSQLQSEHNAAWEPTDSTDSPSEPSVPRLAARLSPEPNSRSTSCVEALDLASNSSKRSSVAASEEMNHTSTKTKAQTPPGSGEERREAWGEEEEEENTDDQEGRLPTPRMRTRPVQRTHHDLTTPAAGGAILVGKLQSVEDSSLNKQQKCGAAVPMTTGMETTAINTPPKHKEAWSENTLRFSSPSPEHKGASSPPSKPIRTKEASPSPAAPPPSIPPPLHGIQGTLRHPDFQHNGELGLRFRELPCWRGGCSPDEDERLSVMSWCSAASCSAASAVLERAQKRRDDFWGTI